MTFPKFSLLALELQQLIMERCKSSELLKLAQVSHDIYAIAMPVLYRHVDLSFHSDVGLFPSNHFNSMVESNCPDRYIGEESFTRLQAQQEAFIDIIVKKISRGALVLSLTWTYLSYYSTWEEADQAQRMMWKAFKLLNRIQRVDMCSFHTSDFPAVPPPLFPTATSIRIGGRMRYAFFRGILSSPENLVSLELDNPQGLEQVIDGVDEDDEMPYFSDNIAFHEETEDANKIPVLRHPGAMRGHLNPLLGRFTNLKHLWIRTVGQDDASDQRWSTAREKARYTEIATFIQSVSSTLVTFSFEQGIEAEKDPNPSCRGDPRRAHQIGRPMDNYFISYVLPTLIEGSWPKVETLSIRGAGGKTREYKTYTNVKFLTWMPEDSAVMESAEHRLRNALNNGVELNWEKEAGRLFYLEEADYTNPHAPWVH